MRMAAMPWPVVEADSRAWIAARRDKAANAFAVLRREDGEFLGSVGFSPEGKGNDPEGVVEIGYWIGREFWNRGWASEAVGLVLGLAARAGAGLATALVFPGNPASERVLQKNGFEYVGDEEKAYPLRGGRRVTRRFEKVL